MISRVLLAFALAHATSAAHFYNPSADLEKSAPGGVYDQDNVAQGVVFQAVNFTDGEAPRQFSDVSAWNRNMLGHCPDTQFFGELSISYMTHSGQCLVKYSAVMWENMKSTVVYDKEVVGEAALSKGFRSQGAPQFYTPCYIIVNNVEFEVYATADADGDEFFDYMDVTTKGPFINFVDHSKGCRQHAVVFSPSIDDESSSIENPSTVSAFFSWQVGTTPVGPMTLTQKSNGDMLVTSAYIYVNYISNWASENGFNDQVDDDEPIPDIFNGKNRAEYLKYTWGVVVTESTYVVRGNYQNITLSNQGTGGSGGFYNTMYLQDFKKRARWIFLNGNAIGEGGINPLRFLDPFPFAADLLPQTIIYETSQDRFGRNKLTLVTSTVSYGDSLSYVYYTYTLVRKNAKNSPFKKNQINEWFGGERQYYQIEDKQNPAARQKPERKRKLHRRKKRRKGKKTDVRDNRRFKLAP